MKGQQIKKKMQMEMEMRNTYACTYLYIKHK